MLIRRSLFLVTFCVLLSTALYSTANPASAANPESTPTIHDRIAGMKAADGLFPTAWDAKTGKLFLEIRKFDEDFLLVVSLPYGLGSNDIGLDRGRLGEERIVHFTRVGPRVLLIAPNMQYRSSSTNPMESMAVKQS
ncbi:MAG: peptidase, partial [Candidatus Sulfotelmatobacter sp.]